MQYTIEEAHYSLQFMHLHACKSRSELSEASSSIDDNLEHRQERNDDIIYYTKYNISLHLWLHV